MRFHPGLKRVYNIRALTWHRDELVPGWVTSLMKFYVITVAMKSELYNTFVIILGFSCWKSDWKKTHYDIKINLVYTYTVTMNPELYSTSVSHNAHDLKLNISGGMEAGSTIRKKEKKEKGIRSFSTKNKERESPSRRFQFLVSWYAVDHVINAFFFIPSKSVIVNQEST